MKYFRWLAELGLNVAHSIISKETLTQNKQKSAKNVVVTASANEQKWVGFNFTQFVINLIKYSKAEKTVDETLLAVVSSVSVVICAGK